MRFGSSHRPSFSRMHAVEGARHEGRTSRLVRLVEIVRTAERQRGRVIVVAFDPGDTTGWSSHSAPKDLLMGGGTRATLCSMRRAMDGDGLYGSENIGWRLGQFGVGEGLDEDQQTDRMIETCRMAWGVWEVDESTDTFFVVLEDFILRRNEMSRSLLSPVRLIAKFEYAFRRKGIYVCRQSPGDAKNVVTDARLRSWNVYQASSGVHARDAQRHGILALRRWGSQPGLRSKAGIGRVLSRVEDMEVRSLVSK